MRHRSATVILIAFILISVVPSSNYAVVGQVNAGQPEKWPLARTLDHKSGILSMAFAPDGKLLLTGGDGGDRSVHIWNVATWTEIQKLDQPEEVYSIAFSPSGHTMAVCCFFPICLWDTAGWKPKRRVSGLNEGVKVVFLNETTVVSASMNEDAAVIDTISGKVIRRLRGHTSPSASIGIAPDKTLVATASWDDTIRLWSTNTWKTVRVLSAGPSGNKEFACFSPDSHLLAAAYGKQDIGLWDIQTGKLLRLLKGHHDVVCTAAFTKDGQLLATGSWDKQIKVWEVRSGRLVQTLSGSAQRVEAVAFSPDEKLLLSAGGDGVVRMWEVRR